jgi:prepilin-type N-terminal cleavage/methylation domain-containing protein
MSETTKAARERGMTLLEVMISLSILLVGLLGMMQLQIWGLTSNQGARAHTQAMQMARDLAAGLEKLPFEDARLASTGSLFGRLVQSDGTLPASGYEDYATATAIPGVQATVPPEFQRLWTVRDAATAGSGVATKIIAVSVVYRERTLPQLREVVLYVQQSNRKLLSSNVAAYQ